MSWHPAHYRECVWFDIRDDIATSDHMIDAAEIIKNAMRAGQAPDIAVEWIRQRLRREAS